jgi:outer membrane receptor protein involved in Fe transport
MVVAISSLPANAQMEAPQSSPEAVQASADSGGGDIVVTAQRRAESINRVPLSVQAFSGKQLTSSGVTDVSSLPLVTTGLNFARSSANTPIYTIRGVGFNTPNLSSTSPVGAYFNEVAYPYPYMTNGPLFDVARVEVLKGPQGTLYGRNTTGGLINFITAQPTDKLEAGVTAELGNYKTYNFESFISGPLTDTLGIRIAGRWENSDKGWQKSISRNDRIGEKDRLGLRATLEWEPSERFALNLVGSYWRDRSDTVATQASFLLANVPPFLQPGVAESIRSDWTSGTADWDPEDGTKPPFRTHSDFYGIAGRMSYKLSDSLSLISLTSYNYVKRRDVTDADGSAIEVFALDSFGHVGSFSEEFRIVGEAGKLNYTVGAYYSVDKIVDDQSGFYDKTSVLQFLRFLSQNVIDPTNSFYTAEQYATGFRTYYNRTRQRSRSASIFGNVDYEISDSFKISGGLRYTDDQLKYKACSTDRDGNTLPVWNTGVNGLVFVQTGIPQSFVQPGECLGFTDDFTGHITFDHAPLNEHSLAGRLSAQFTPSSDMLFYATLSRGYKSGAVPMLPTNVDAQREAAHQEKLTAYEIGTKLSLVDRAVQLNVAGFYYDYRGKQLFSAVLDPVFIALNRLVNVPKSRVIGAEAGVDVRPVRELNLHLGGAYTDTKIQKFQGFDRGGVPTDFAGRSFPYSPKWQFNGSIGYDAPVTPSLGLAANVSANYQSKTSGSIGGEQGFEVKGYTVVNASLTLHDADEKWRVGLYANNLFDKYYWSAVDKVADLVFRVPGMARTYGLRLSWNY